VFSATINGTGWFDGATYFRAKCRQRLLQSALLRKSQEKK
jgi:hypothetical protein